MARNNVKIMFWISPVLGLVEAFRDLRSKQARQVLFWFCLCFGLCFSVGTERYEGSNDGISMRTEFEESKSMTTAQYITYLKDYFEFDTGAQDIYIVSVSYFVSRVTDNYHYFFLVLAFVFAFFQLKCLQYFVKETNYRNSLICLILVCLFLWNNIYNINGARFWTAAWFGLFCAFKAFYDKKPLYILLSSCTLLIHASFAIFPFMLLFAYAIRGFDKPWLVLFITSWIFSVVAGDFQIFPFIKDIDLPFLVGKKVEYYTDKDNFAVQGSGFYWVQLLFRYISRNYIEILILLIILNIKKLTSKHSKSIVKLMIVLAILSNFGMVVPTFGGRFFALNLTLVAYSFLVTFGEKKFKALVYLLPFAWFMNLFYLSKDIISVLDLGFLLSPVFSFFRYLVFV